MINTTRNNMNNSIVILVLCGIEKSFIYSTVKTVKFFPSREVDYTVCKY